MSSEYIPISEVKAYIQAQIGQTVPADDHLIVQWIYKAVSDIGVDRLFERKCIIRIDDDCIATKPDDYVGIIEIQLLNEQDDCIGYPVYGDTCLCVRNCTSNVNSEYRVEKNEDDDFQFGTNIIDVGITKIRLKYYAIPVKDGMPAVPSYTEEAVLAYCNWRHLQRTRNKYRTSTRNVVSISEVSEAEKTWLIRRRAARVKVRNRLNGDKVRQIGERFIYDWTNIFPPTADERIKNVYARYLW